MKRTNSAATIGLARKTLVLLTAVAFAGQLKGALVKPQLMRQSLASSSYLTRSALSLSQPAVGQSFIETSVPAPGAGADIAALLGAAAFYDRGITGQGAKVANVEAGHIWNGHLTLGHVVEYMQDATAWDDPGTPGGQITDLVDFHATAVGQTIGGRHGDVNRPRGVQVGIAPDANLASGAIAADWIDFSSGQFEVTGATLLSAYGAYFGNADVINSSWGFPDPLAGDAYTIALDGLAHDFPSTTFVVAAGNDADPDFDPSTPPVGNTVSAPASGYNSIAVGALQNDGQNGYHAAADFSGRGPQGAYFVDLSSGTPSLVYCLDCRAAVDITAPGTDLMAAAYLGPTGSNNPTLPDTPAFDPGLAGANDLYFVGLSGTSLAAPIVSGAATLLDSASYNNAELVNNPASRDARVIKAVLLNSADKSAGWNNGAFEFSFGGPSFKVTTQALDFVTGAGILNVGRAYDQYLGTGGTHDVVGANPGDQGFVSPTGWDFGVAELGIDNSYLVAEELAAGSTFTATLTWFRERSTDLATAGIADSGQADLDLFLVDAITGDIVFVSGGYFNTVEHVHAVLPRTSYYAVIVSFGATVFGDVVSAPYGLAWSVSQVPEPNAQFVLVVAVALACPSYRRKRFT